MTHWTSQVVIAGAGIVGAACARALARRGLEVTVVDRGSVGGGASAAGMGHIVVMDDSPAQFQLCRYSQGLWDELAEQFPMDCEFDRCGTLWVAATDKEMQEVHRKHEWFRAHGVCTEIIDERGVTAEEPNLRMGLRGGLLAPDDSVIYPPCAAQWLLAEAQREGAAVKLGATITHLDGTMVRLSDGSQIAAETTINALGSEAPKITPDLPVRPKKGHLVITDRYPGFAHHQILELGYLTSAHENARESVAFNLQPRRTGQLLLGSSRQLDDDTLAVDHSLLQRMIARAVDYMPELAGLSALRVWTGVRAATPDSLPIIGPHPEIAGLYIATGHEGLGITTSLGTAELLAAQLTDSCCPISIEPFQLSRFAGALVHV